ncbi:MAG TPA: hypothetical protein VIM46_02565 [Luteolibacter sp.]
MSSRRQRRRNGDTRPASAGRWLAAAGAAVLVAMAGGYLGLRGYLHGENFRQFLSTEAGEALKADVRFGKFQWSGLQMGTESFEAADGQKIQRLRADRIQTEIGFGGLRRGVWELRESDIGKLDVSIDARDNDAPPFPPRAPEPPLAGRPHAGKPSRWLPSEIELHGLTVRDLALRALLKDGLVSAEGMRVRIDPESQPRSYRATVEGGALTTPWSWAPPVALERMQLRWHDGEWFLTRATATVWKHGRLEADGEWNPRTRLYSAQGRLTDLESGDLLNADWSKRLTGRAESDFTLESRAGSPVAHGRLQLHDGVLTALPFLDSLAAYADTQRFRVLPLSEAVTDWEYERGALTLRNLVIASEGLARIEGTLTLRGDQLDGAFRLGLAPGTLARIPGAETDVFLPGERGLLWAPLRITGTTDHPREDLTDRLIAAAGARMFEQLPATGEKVLKFTHRALAEHAPEVLDQGSRALEKGLDKGTRALDKADRLLLKANRALDSLLGEEPPPPAETPPPAPLPPAESR